jgi:RES domain-containing protein
LSIKVWRICKKKYAATAFDGEGSSKVGNRWNSKGFKMAYTSANLSLATLEFFVHFELENTKNLELTSIWAEIPDSVQVESIEISDLPEDWKHHIAPPALASIGDKWLQMAKTAVLVVPSAITPYESNYLLNPEHPDFASIKIGTPESFVLDKRMFKGRL